MKNTNHSNNGGAPFFWQPWGCLGCLWRLIAFLAILMLVMWLLSLLRGCGHDIRGGETPFIGGDDDPEIEQIERMGDEYPVDSLYEPADTVGDWRSNLPGDDPYLPAEEDNYIPPYTDDQLVDDEDGQRLVGNKLNVILDSDANDETFRRWAQEFKQLYPGQEYRVVFYDPNTKTLQIQVPPSRREQVKRDLPRQISDISFKIFDESVLEQSAVTPNDPVFKFPKLSWYFAPIQAFEAWEITQGSPEVNVAVVDSYFDLNHDELRGSRIKHAYSVEKRNANVAPDPSADVMSKLHGTFVASIAVGNINNARGSAGIAPKCSLIPVSMGAQLTSMKMLNGILYAIYKGANVINVSAGSFYNDGFVRQMRRRPIDQQIEAGKGTYRDAQDVWDYVTELATKRNVTIVWAAGNQDIYSGFDPSKRCPEGIMVGAVNQKLAKSNFSNVGNSSELNVYLSTVSAPGSGIFSAAPGNKYVSMEGTSFAAPIVTGAVALMKSIDPTLTNEEIIDILKKTGRKPSDGCTTIGPIVQLKNALTKVKSNFVRLEDLLKDHTKIQGLWQSTELLTAYNQNGPTGEMVRKYFEFANDRIGRSIVYETGSKRDYTAPVSVTWTDNGVKWSTNGRQHTCPGAQTGYVASDYECTPDANGLLMCAHRSREYGQGKPFYLKKVTSRKKE